MKFNKSSLCSIPFRLGSSAFFCTPIVLQFTLIHNINSCELNRSSLINILTLLSLFSLFCFVQIVEFISMEDLLRLRNDVGSSSAAPVTAATTTASATTHVTDKNNVKKRSKSQSLLETEDAVSEGSNSKQNNKSNSTTTTSSSSSRFNGARSPIVAVVFGPGRGALETYYRNTYLAYLTRSAKRLFLNITSLCTVFACL